MTQEQIIQETFDIYKHPENRSIDKDGIYCMYNGTEGKLCAYARIIKPEHRHLLTEINGADNQPKLKEIKNPYIAGYGGKSMAFYSFIQNIHDTLLEEGSLDHIKKAKNPKSKIDFWVRVNGKTLSKKVQDFAVEAAYNAIFQTIEQ